MWLQKIVCENEFIFLTYKNTYIKLIILVLTCLLKEYCLSSELFNVWYSSNFHVCGSAVEQKITDQFSSVSGAFWFIFFLHKQLFKICVIFSSTPSSSSSSSSSSSYSFGSLDSEVGTNGQCSQNLAVCSKVLGGARLIVLALFFFFLHCLPI